jgi:hypothetical protein
VVAGFFKLAPIAYRNLVAADYQRVWKVRGGCGSLGAGKP